MSAELRGKVAGEDVLGGQGPCGSGETPRDAVDRLIGLSLEAKMHAYCPYSKFRVGAALLAHDDKVFTGRPPGCVDLLSVWSLLFVSLAFHIFVIQTSGFIQSQGLAYTLHIGTTIETQH